MMFSLAESVVAVRIPAVGSSSALTCSPRLQHSAGALHRIAALIAEARKEGR